jgi:hypothetical protein
MIKDHPLVKKSMLRKEIEALLEEKGIIQENRILVANLDDDETKYFENYPDALEFLKGRKGRWYITAPGWKHSREEH